MSEWNPVSVEKAILEVINEIAAGIPKASEAYANFLAAEHEHDVAVAKAYMNYEGAAHAKKYVATLQTVTERIKRDATDVAYRLIERTNRMLEKKLDAIRSIGVSVRQAYQDAGRGEW